MCAFDKIKLITLFIFSPSRSIQESGVTRIEDKAFKALRQLVKLFLNGNNLGIFRGQVFYGLRRLEQL